MVFYQTMKVILDSKNMVVVMFFHLIQILKKLEVMIDNLDRPNGIAISPDEKKLYVADTGENIKHLYVYDMIDGLPRNRKLVYDFKPFF